MGAALVRNEDGYIFDCKLYLVDVGGERSHCLSETLLIAVFFGVTLGSDVVFFISKFFVNSFTLGSDTVSVVGLVLIIGKEGILLAVWIFLIILTMHYVLYFLLLNLGELVMVDLKV